jgi:lysyl-tRNA synthetase class 2
MSTLSGLRFLRPYLLNEVAVSRRSAYTRFFNSSRCLARELNKSGVVRKIGEKEINNESEHLSGVQERIQELDKAQALQWPRIKDVGNAMRISEFAEKYKNIQNSEIVNDGYVTLRGMLSGSGEIKAVADSSVGRIDGFRVAGSKLVFIDIRQDNTPLQIVCNQSRLATLNGVAPSDFKKFYHLIRRGDIICMFAPQAQL